MKNAVVLITILSALAVVSLTACGATKTALDDTEWVLESYGEQGDLQAVLEGTEITASFNGAEGQVTGSAGCNSYFASYEVKGSKLSIFQMAWTEMACVSPEGVMEQEREYLTLLSNAESYEIKEGKLQVISGSQVLIFNTGELKASLGQEFTLSIGQSAQIEEENLQIKFEEWLEDSRCATGATCIWEGRVSIAVEIKDNGSPYKMVLIQYGLNNQYASETYKAYQLTFKVNPYPELGTEIATGDYQLLLTVSER